MKALGICLGASTVSLVQLEKGGGGSPGAAVTTRIVAADTLPHDGNPKAVLSAALRQLDLTGFDRVAATGRKFRRIVNLTSISEPEAVEYAYRFLKPPGLDCPAVISAGGETFMVYVLDRHGRISNVLTGNKCASGTGEFFLQQLRRMNVSLEEAAQWAADETPHHVSGRCSVFCKSDCTHATNKGVPKAKVTAGLCRMMANKVLELLKKVERRNLMIVGGTSRNHMMIAYLKREIPGLIVPEQAPYFEALGVALWALENEVQPFPGLQELYRSEVASFDTLAPLADAASMVEFKTMEHGIVRAADECLLGLDVGSTTTKAVLVRRADDAMLASVYLRTSGDPVGASRQCYAALLEQVRRDVDPAQISITGLGVCGSGRQIAGLHALTEGVINEIIAHAAAAVYFDPGVDTLFEIGGQDAKYTYITNGVPSDYAMNEACSAGTGSFLEESALETLGVPMEAIADVALKGENPPNFNDQCAAFIASDIKNAIHEGVAHEDIVAGLVYSICMNYNNRVKGNRPVGAKVFMQGGVCYNRAVPLAMAALVGKSIVVPPEPGLMGAFGVALEVKKRMDLGLMASQRFDLAALAGREVKYGKTFICKGGKEKCDRRCEIALIELEGRRYPFGGACNRYYNLRRKVRYDINKLDLVRQRQKLVFEQYAVAPGQDPEAACRGTIAVNRSFMVNTYYPLYSNFFAALGYRLAVPDSAAQEGIDRRNAAFCYPGELAHGFFHTLLHTTPRPDYIFLPHFKAVPSMDARTRSQVCPLVQGETFYLRSTFKEELRQFEARGGRLLTPLLDMTDGLHTAEGPLVDTAVRMGAGRQDARRAFRQALRRQEDCLERMVALGQEALQWLAGDPDRFAVVIFARPYNGFVEEAHMGIPHKLASRGVLVLPLDFLPLEAERAKRHMYWGMGQRILRGARLVKRNPQLFGTFITNFSCGPDSFLVGYFRSIMGRKPSLTLELDSHTADAGLDTRIEAFLDITTAYRQLVAGRQLQSRPRRFQTARAVFEEGRPGVITSDNRHLPMTDPRVTVVVPSMGQLGSEAITAVFRGLGLKAYAHPAADEAILKLGRGNTSCKECLPLILTTGTLLNYVNNGRRSDEVVVYFMPTGSGPCRFGQYSIFMEDLVQRLELPDVAMFSLSSENSYLGMSGDFERRAWWAVIVSDVMEDARSMLLANARDIDDAMAVFRRQWRGILKALEQDRFRVLESRVARVAERLRTIPLKRPVREVPTISLTGEIFVRRDALSRRFITEELAKKGFATVCAPVAEWVHYCDYMMGRQIQADFTVSWRGRLRVYLRKRFLGWYEKRLKMALARSGLVHADPVRVEPYIANAAPHITADLPGEAVLTVGGALTEVARQACGVIAIGPFGCMPNRLSESLLNDSMNREGKLETDPGDTGLRKLLTDVEDLPFLAIESDGSPFPQLITAKLETFCLRAERLHARMQSLRHGGHA